MNDWNIKVPVSKEWWLKRMAGLVADLCKGKTMDNGLEKERNERAGRRERQNHPGQEVIAGRELLLLRPYGQAEERT